MDIFRNKFYVGSDINLEIFWYNKNWFIYKKGYVVFSLNVFLEVLRGVLFFVVNLFYKILMIMFDEF